MAIYFHEDGVSVKLKDKGKLRTWVKRVIVAEDKVPGDLNIIITTDEKLLGVNRNFLSRDYLTDIITFDYTEGNKISGDLYISIERIRENAIRYSEPEIRELWRVIIHGVLHLIGYSDETNRDRSKMREKEDTYLNIKD